MKKCFFSILFLAIAIAGLSQSYPCDIATNGLTVNPGSIPVGQTADFRFVVYNNGTDVNCAIPANTVRVVLSLPSTNDGRPQYYQYQSVVTPTGGVGTYFTFTYDGIENVVVGTNNTALPNGMGQTVVVRVTGIGATSSSGATTTLGIQQGGGITDNIANNLGATPLIVTTILPLKLGSFTTSSKGCQNTIDWSTLQEDNTKSFTIEASKDGLSFKAIGIIGSAGNSTVRRNYSYTDAAPTDGITYYRLKMTDADGKFTYSSVVNVRTECGVKTVSVYPNPLLIHQQKLIVTVGGYKGQIKGELLSAAGQVVEKYTLRNGTNNLTVGNLSLGSYILRVTDVQTGEATSQKILVIR